MNFFFLLKVIGKGGEQMVRIQNDTGCKLQIAAESRGAPERVVTMMGGKENIE
jgi:far upstream element-binding protein